MPEVLVIGTTVITYLSGFLICLYFLLILFKFFKEVWWTPICLQSKMRSQGIRGPAYRFLHGNTKEINNMRKESLNNPIELSDHHTLPRVQPHIYSWIKLYGTNFFYWNGTRAQLVVTDPLMVKEILSSREDTYSKGGFQKYIKKLLGDGLVLSRGEKWLKMRKLANHSFHGESLRDMFPEMVAGVEMMLEKWRDNDVKETDVSREFKILTSEIISRTAFGSSYLEGEKIFDMLMKLIFITARNNFEVRIPGIEKFFKRKDDIESDKLQQGIRDIILNMIKKREGEVMIDKQEGGGIDFLGSLIKSYNDPDKTKKISVDDLIDECKTFYVAGQETTASSLTWTILLLSVHTDWQDKARKEVIQIFGEQNPTADGISKLKIVSMIINESLRLYSPVVSMTRYVEREVRLGNLVIPANVEIFISTFALHHNPQIWGEDVHLFKPERFAEGTAKATNNNVSAFFPFGFGPRTCAGFNFAITEMKIILSMILQHYRFSLSPTYVHSPVPILTLCPQYGVQIMLEAL